MASLRLMATPMRRVSAEAGRERSRLIRKIRTESLYTAVYNGSRKSFKSIARHIQQVLELDLEIAIGVQDFAALLGEFCAAAAAATGGGDDQRARPGVVHCIEQQPGAAIGEVKAAGGGRE